MSFSADAQMSLIQLTIGLEQLIVKLFWRIDRNDAQGVAALFTADGVWQRRDGERAGHAAIVEEMGRRASGRLIEHLISNFMVHEIDGATAQVTFRALAYADECPSSLRPSPLTSPLALDAYCARLVEDDGRWQVAHLEGERLFSRPA